ncbi:MAG: hypothetical protein IJM45_05395 [Clostridia bacterium]|nr:hypothetical protein [Clostridia bacterium]MBQ9879853.1 hypothetical protein [Clostridia bacterium]
MAKLDELRELICDYVDIAPEEITEETNIRTGLGMNSLDLVSLALDIEKKYDLDIPEREISGIETIADVIRLIDAQSDEEE